MTSKEPYRFIISGGGTGGHIYPALAVANEIKSQHPDSEILFVGAQGKMEMTKVPEAGYKIVGLWISGLQRRVTIQNLLLPFKVIHSFFSAIGIVKKFSPNAVLGFGGYASGPMMFAANSRKVPTLIQEQNSYAGLTNKKFGKKAKSICVAYEGMEQYFPKDVIKFTGNPVRSDILSLENKRDEAIQHFELDPNKKTVLVLGGSLGARTINRSIAGHLDKVVKGGFQVLWQTGRFYYNDMKNVAADYGSNIKVHEFIKRMDLAYASADVVVSRAGALSISELCLVGKPTILVPSPNVAEDHQTKNARSLCTNGAAILIRDSESEKSLMNNVVDLLGDKEKQASLSAALKKMGKPNATKDIVSEVMRIIN
ncbi:undecaprenyldiphospho-muramoylpentapeptide beta-N-acetylglucosaminyltransferase [Fulvivirga lutea]|uniref:UDP-N-acetylglucosamine--N-acetylmuramyl-(pentapeptide) pyrophosphoryl-undecaprenol N-acetylglucosamine transferase n=1 Tax=Fulvivirga lutea TaxID=2810512 RepID=A0A974WI89_9BACT|nr:undecaprenyldiphospho-muramoylpentapeptide beta-N-acetylglucosaminyltransferase [Fulvivirga lutea]QSE99043.1 undecaprenyldiphospho-muramoylpentapeptide beta-N-acetylglucosaminyltransferase [Fulvivirga lutea]